MKINSQNAEGLMQQYTNELTAGMLASFDKPAFSDEQLTTMKEEWQERIAKQQIDLKLHRVVEIYRIALGGSRLSNGDEIISTSQSTGIMVLHRDIPAAKEFLADNFELAKMLAAEPTH